MLYFIAKIFKHCLDFIKMMNKAYKISFMLTAIGSILYFMINELKADGIQIASGVSIILAIVVALLLFFIWLYFRSEDKKVKQK